MGAEIAIKSLASSSELLPERILGVGMLGVGRPLAWHRTEEALVVRLPLEPPCEHAYTLKVTLDMET